MQKPETFKIPGAEGEYHCPYINFDQLGRIITLFPRLKDLLTATEFRPDDPDHLCYATLLMVTERDLFNKLAALCICPASREYWKPEDYDKNLEFVGRLTPDYLIDTAENGDARPGVLARSFLFSNGNFLEVLKSWVNSFRLAKIFSGEQETPDNSQDTSRKDGTGSTKPSSSVREATFSMSEDTG